jgi:hypothetical protein
LSAELTASHPDIKTWRVVGVDDPSITGRIDFTTKGFHGMLVLADGETIFIDPDKDETTNIYHSLSKLENASHFEEHFNCETHDKHFLLSNKTLSNAGISKTSTKNLSNNKLEKLPAPELITYRLAVAGTAEYTSVLGGKTSAYSSMVTTINRVNEIYQRDLGVKLELVSDEALLYTDSATDPYTNDSASELVNENMSNMDTVFGKDNYDLGHVFAEGIDAGLAFVEVACLDQANVGTPASYITVNGIKAGGASGFYSPEGETFSIDLVAHEIGHQLGANHTFNGVNGFCAGNLNAETAVEPGAGSTIMSYSGNCGTDSFQSDPDAMFHWKSISEINNYTRIDSTGSSCGVRTSTGNQAPIANAGSDHIIPVNTPFLLDGEAITGGATYAWDQVDAGTVSAVDVDKGDNAIIRSLHPTVNPDRYIPRLSDLFTGGNTVGEILPQTVRNLNFSFVVRDSNGEVANDLKLISTENTGANFQVLSHDLDETLSTGQSTNVTWEVASTTNIPINCAKVNIQLLRVDGVKNDLLMSTDNDGSETVVVPSSTPSMTNARIMVGCATQPFFQISAGNINIQQGVDSTPPVISITGSSTVNAIKGSTYNDKGATATDNFDDSITVTSVSTVNMAILGTYTVTYTATDNAGNTSTEIRAVNVVPDTVAPVITIIGLSSLDIIQGSNYTDAGATATDNVDTSVSVAMGGSVETNTVDTYIITYTAVDSSGNLASPVTRTVNVVSNNENPPVVDNEVVNENPPVVDNEVVNEKPPVVVNVTNNASGGGSMGLWLLPLALFGLRRRLLSSKAK